MKMSVPPILRVFLHLVLIKTIRRHRRLASTEMRVSIVCGRRATASPTRASAVFYHSKTCRNPPNSAQTIHLLHDMVGRIFSR